MGDDELPLTDEQKLNLAANFIFLSPPAQQLKVVEDVKTLVGPPLTESKQELHLAALHMAQFAAVSLPDGSKVLITTHGQLPRSTEAKPQKLPDAFIDPGSKQAFRVNHSKLECVSVQSLPPDISSELNAVAKLRDAIDSAMQSHTAEWLPSGVVTTYGSKEGGEKITCCVAALASDLSNYSAGRWWGQWTLTTGGGSVGRLKGEVKCHVHYFEDGNVQLDDSGNYECDLPLGDNVGAAFVAKVREFEQEWITKMEDIYQTLSEQVLQSLRRRLPITRMKFDWEKHAVAKLAMDLQAQAVSK